MINELYLVTCDSDNNGDYEDYYHDSQAVGVFESKYMAIDAVNNFYAKSLKKVESDDCPGMEFCTEKMVENLNDQETIISWEEGRHVYCDEWKIDYYIQKIKLNEVIV